MFIAQKLDPVSEGSALNGIGARFEPVLGVLLFLALIATALLIVATVALGHGDGAGLVHRLDDLLPADLRLWSGFTA